MIPNHLDTPLPRQRPLVAYIAAMFALGGAMSVCHAAPSQVTNCNDSGSGSLRAAVASATSGESIDMQALTCSTITLTSGGISTNLDNLSILGPGQGKLTITGPPTPEAPFAAINTATGTFHIANLTVANGHGVGPGCVYAKGNLSLSGVTVTGCTSVGNVGGGVRTRGNLTMVNSTLSDNTEVNSFGGGGAWVDGNATISNSTISNNVATTDSPYYGSFRAGGLYVGGNLSLSHSTISGNRVSSSRSEVPAFGGGASVNGDAHIVFSIIGSNSASGAGTDVRGGGIYIGSPAGPANYAYFGYSTISGNSIVSSTTGSVANVQGGGISSEKPFGFKFSTIDHNHSNGVGGGIGAGANAHLNMTMSTISGNIAGFQGGAIFTSYDKTMLLLNSTVAENYTATATRCAGIFFNYGGMLTTESSIIAKNTKYNSNLSPCDIGGNSPLTISAVNGHNLIQNSIATVSADTISGDPQFFTLANNGGVTQTLGIAQSSPARQAGSNLFNLSSDQRGFGYPRTRGGKTDIGAFEWQGIGDGDTIFRNGFDLQFQ
ncbi:MAG TPA: choice-of-anchor Q domain-containing protein [Rudaea sp.]|nr:choice-of-anchor Q domain-containing protein [Rudaea sp.]